MAACVEDIKGTRLKKRARLIEPEKMTYFHPTQEKRLTDPHQQKQMPPATNTQNKPVRKGHMENVLYGSKTKSEATATVKIDILPL